MIKHQLAVMLKKSLTADTDTGAIRYNTTTYARRVHAKHSEVHGLIREDGLEGALALEASGALPTASTTDCCGRQRGSNSDTFAGKTNREDGERKEVQAIKTPDRPRSPRVVVFSSPSSHHSIPLHITSAFLDFFLEPLFGFLDPNLFGLRYRHQYQNSTTHHESKPRPTSSPHRRGRRHCCL